MPKPVLIVEDDTMQAQMLATLLRKKLDFGAQFAENGRDALEILEADAGKTIKLVVMDLEMPVMGGMEALEIMRQRYPSTPVVMLTGSQDISDAVEAMKLGAVDFLTKPYEAHRLSVTVKNALKISTLSKEVTRLKHETEGTFGFENLIGSDAGLSPIVTLGRKAAASDIPTLITGETGTGKEVFSKAIHGESARAGGPFIAVNCGAIPSQLVESTLFGHEKGSFTGATEKTIGKFREAEGGTIFLDEVGELPLDTQVKLLRVLQQKEVEPVGAGKAVSINVRIVSATNRDLQAEVNDGHFREDLFFRLNVLTLELPPLRKRKSDIPLLTQHFIDRFCVREGGIPKQIASETLQALQNHNWPGNVRELENTINRAMVMSEGQVLDIPEISSQAGAVYSENSATFSHNSDASKLSLVGADGTFQTMDDIEASAMRAALNHHTDNITQAAKALGIAKSTFYKKMKNYGI